DRPRGGVVLLDFGVARIRDTLGAGITESQQMLGTLLYSAPEQLTGAKVDARADVYALGVLAYEMMAHPGRHGPRGGPHPGWPRARAPGPPSGSPAPPRHAARARCLASPRAPAPPPGRRAAWDRRCGRAGHRSARRGAGCPRAVPGAGEGRGAP